MKDFLSIALVVIIVCTPIWGTYALTFIEAKDLALGLGVINLTAGCMVWPAIGVCVGDLITPN